MGLKQLIVAWIMKSGVLIDFVKGSGNVSFLSAS